MLTVVAGTKDELPSGLEVDLAGYRHAIFIESLGWQLPVENGLERDQFDRADTLYVVAKDKAEVVCGCARLLPTTKPYLLDEVFPHLLGDTPAPHSRQIWELSRFSSKPKPGDETLSREEARRRFGVLFAALATAALAKGATRLITFTAMGVERILRNMGLHAHRVGPPQMVDNEPVLALWIELDSITCGALGVKFEHGKATQH
jgi:acyl homoserine lactone synthase